MLCPKGPSAQHYPTFYVSGCKDPCLLMGFGDQILLILVAWTLRVVNLRTASATGVDRCPVPCSCWPPDVPGRHCSQTFALNRYDLLSIQCVYTYVHMHIYIHINIYICIYVCMCACICIYIYACMCTHIYTFGDSGAAIMSASLGCFAHPLVQATPRLLYLLCCPRPEDSHGCCCSLLRCHMQVNYLRDLEHSPQLTYDISACILLPHWHVNVHSIRGTCLLVSEPILLCPGSTGAVAARRTAKRPHCVWAGESDRPENFIER